jgi:hypothetical protein
MTQLSENWYICLFAPSSRYWDARKLSNQNDRIKEMSVNQSIDPGVDLAEWIGRIWRAWDEAEYLRCEAEREEEGFKESTIR